jgi:hypothetical protein
MLRTTIGLGWHNGHDRMCRDRGRDGRNDGDRAVPIPGIVLNDDRWPGFPNFISSGWIKFNEVDFIPSRRVMSVSI